jgi:hypothetical protein
MHETCTTCPAFYCLYRRAHKSNGVFYVVDLSEGSWYQKCYDPECRRYRSPLTPLPPHILAALAQQQGQGQGLQQQVKQQDRGAAAHGLCNNFSGSSGSSCCSCGGSGGAAQAAAGPDEDGLMLQALEQYEQHQQSQQQQRAQQRQQQQSPIDGKTAPHGAAAAAAPAETIYQPTDDALLLDALLQYEQQQQAAAVVAVLPAPAVGHMHCRELGVQPLQQRQPLRRLFLSTPPAQPPPPPPPHQLEMWEKFL